MDNQYKSVSLGHIGVDAIAECETDSKLFRTFNIEGHSNDLFT